MHFLNIMNKLKFRRLTKKMSFVSVSPWINDSHENWNNISTKIKQLTQELKTTYSSSQ